MSIIYSTTQKPIGYVKGPVYFLDCKIDLSKRPFIPRPETEYWIRKVIKQIKLKTKKREPRTNNQKLYCLDIFAGSGCIGLAALKQLPNVSVDFVEKEKKFLKQIALNAAINRLDRKRYRTIRSDIFSSVRGRYDYILANPPYVAGSRAKEVDPEVLKWEPRKALFAGKDGLDVIRKFLPEAIRRLKSRGELWMEFDPSQKDAIAEVLKNSGAAFSFFRDQYGKWRYLVAVRKKKCADKKGAHLIIKKVSRFLRAERRV